MPNEPLNNFQLIKAAKKLKLKHFKGVFVRDQLPKNTQKEECGIVNTGDFATRGFHWVCYTKMEIKNIYFDSYVLPPMVEVVNYLKSPVYYNSDRVQFGDTSFCGHLCLYVLKKLDEGFNFQNITNNLW